MSHPNTEFEGTPLWKTIEKEIKSLVENQDLQLTTAPEFVIGSLCKCLVKAGVAVREKMVNIGGA